MTTHRHIPRRGRRLRLASTLPARRFEGATMLRTRERATCRLSQPVRLRRPF
jgi:hypothetical protein